MAAAVPSFERATEGAKPSDGWTFSGAPTKLLIGGKWSRRNPARLSKL